MRETEYQLAIFYHQPKLPVLGLYMFNWVVHQRDHRNLQTTLAVDKTIGYALQVDSKAPLLTTTPVQLIENGDVELVPTWNLHSSIPACLVQKGTQHTVTKEM